MKIKIQVFDDIENLIKDEVFYDAIDLIAWICRYYQESRRAFANIRIRKQVKEMV